MKIVFNILVLSVILFSCTTSNSEKKDIQKSKNISLNIKDVDVDTVTHYRGLDYNGGNYYITGTKGVYHVKSSTSINSTNIDSAAFTDLRDVYANKHYTLAMGIASPGVIWKKVNSNWEEVYRNNDSLVFMDGMAFWNDSTGLVYGDPLDGYHFILKTTDAGNSWRRISSENIPPPLDVEAGFAASGTGVVCQKNGASFIGLGGEKSRVLISHDYGESWVAVETPMLHGNAGKGIYAMAFKDELNGIAVGGNWEDVTCDSSKIFTSDGGKTWNLSSGIQHYRSNVTYLKDNIYIATGTSGTDITYNGGVSWQLLDSTGFNAIVFGTDSTGIAVGSKGVISELKLLN